MINSDVNKMAEELKCLLHNLARLGTVLESSESIKASMLDQNRQCFKDVCCQQKLDFEIQPKHSSWQLAWTLHNLRFSVSEPGEKYADLFIEFFYRMIFLRPKESTEQLAEGAYTEGMTVFFKDICASFGFTESSSGAFDRLVEVLLKRSLHTTALRDEFLTNLRARFDRDYGRLTKTDWSGNGISYASDHIWRLLKKSYELKIVRQDIKGLQSKFQDRCNNFSSSKSIVDNFCKLLAPCVASVDPERARSLIQGSWRAGLENFLSPHWSARTDLNSCLIMLLDYGLVDESMKDYFIQTLTSEINSLWWREGEVLPVQELFVGPLDEAYLAAVKYREIKQLCKQLRDLDCQDQNYGRLVNELIQKCLLWLPKSEVAQVLKGRSYWNKTSFFEEMFQGLLEACCLEKTLHCPEVATKFCASLTYPQGVCKVWEDLQVQIDVQVEPGMLTKQDCQPLVQALNDQCYDAAVNPVGKRYFYTLATGMLLAAGSLISLLAKPASSLPQINTMFKIVWLLHSKGKGWGVLSQAEQLEVQDKILQHFTPQEQDELTKFMVLIKERTFNVSSDFIWDYVDDKVWHAPSCKNVSPELLASAVKEFKQLWQPWAMQRKRCSRNSKICAAGALALGAGACLYKLIATPKKISLA